MTLRSSRRRISLAAAAALVVLSGCSTAPLPQAAQPSVDLPAAAPATLANKAMWRADIAPGSTPLSTPLGVLVVLPGGQPGTYRAARLNPATGTEQWATVAFPSPALPRLAYTTQDGRDWLVAVVDAGPDAVRVFGFDLLGGSPTTPVTTASTFKGAKGRPQVVITDAGVMVARSTKPTFQYRPGTAEATRYGSGPKRGKDVGQPYAVHDNGFLVTFPRGGFAFASATGGWDSTTTAPVGAVAASGTVLRVRDDLVLAQWVGVNKQPLLAVHSLPTGQVLSQQPVGGAAPTAGLRGTNLVGAPDGSAVAWGPYLFDLRQPAQSKVLDLGGGQPASINRGVVYVDRMTRPVATPSATPSASASVTPAAPASSASTTAATPAVSPSATPAPDGFTGKAALDAVTGAVLSDQVGMLPLTTTAANQALLVYGTPTSTTIFSVAVR